jgi:hypothetical protein
MKTPKQTTIYLDIEEQVDPLEVVIFPRGPQHRGAYSMPFLTMPQNNAFDMVTRGKDRNVHGVRVFSFHLKKQDGQTDAQAWAAFRARILRVLNNRPDFVTKCEQVNPLRYKFTVYWNKPKARKSADTPGVWTLRERANSGRTVRIIETFPGALECSGDDLYCHLPEGDVPEGFEVFPDFAVVNVWPVAENDTRNGYEFTFKHATQKKRAAFKK